MSIIDSHCHLDKFYLAGELENILSRVKDSGVEHMIAVGTGLEDWPLYATLAGKYPNQISYTVGLHPTSVQENWLDSVREIEGYWTRNCKPCGLGEIGLDYYHLPKEEMGRVEVIQWQKEAFIAQLAIVKKLGVPLVIHCRDAFEDTIEIIDNSGCDWNRIVFHCFSGSAEEVKLLNEKGGRASFTGVVTFKNAESVREAFVAQGLDRLMIETDCPYMAPVPMRGKRNEPAYVRHIATYCAEFLEMEYKELDAITTKNAKEFFGLSYER